MKFRQNAVKILLLLYSFVAVMPGSCANSKAPESDVKAGFILNFIRFANWPDEHLSGKIFIGYLHESDLEGKLLLLNGGKVGNNKLVVKQFDHKEAENFHVLFISHPDSSVITSLLEKVKDNKILTISDSPGFAKQGGMIELVLLNNKIRFNINHAAVTSAGIKLSSQLLNLAYEIHK